MLPTARPSDLEAVPTGDSNMGRYFRLFDDYFREGGLTSPPDDVVAVELENARAPAQGLWVEVSEGEPWPHFMTGGALVVSEMFLRMLESAGVTGVESRPIPLNDLRTRSQRIGWAKLEVPRVANVVVLERSDYDVLMEGSDDGAIPPLLAFSTIVLDEEKVQGRRLFALVEDPTVLIVDEAVKDAIAAQRPPEGWGVMLEELEPA